MLFRSTNEYGSYYQNTYNFTTINGAPYVPTCVLPTDGGVNITRRPRLEVLALDPNSDSLRVDFYLVNYSYLGSMNGSSGQDFYWEYPSSWMPLDYLTGYSWYANVTDYWGATNTSGILNFITRDSIAPDKPSQPLPINNSVDQEYAMKYTLRCLVTDPDGDQMNVSIYWNGTLLDTFYNVNSGSFVTFTLPFDLQASTTYLWTVNVTECTGRAYENYSEFTFTTHLPTQFWSMSIPQLVFFLIVGLWILLLIVGEWKDDPMFSCICGVVGLVLVPSELALFGLSVYTIGLGAAWGILNFYILFLSLIFLIRMIKGRRKR